MPVDAVRKATAAVGRLMANGDSLHGLPLSISSLLTSLCTAGVLGLFAWTYNLGSESTKHGAQIDGIEQRLNAQAIRITSASDNLSSLQISVIDRLQRTSSEVLTKVETAEASRQQRSDQLQQRIEALVEAIYELRGDFKASTQRLDQIDSLIRERQPAPRSEQPRR